MVLQMWCQWCFLQELMSQSSNLVQIPCAEATLVICLKLHSHREGRHLIFLFFFFLVPFCQIRKPISEVKLDWPKLRFFRDGLRYFSLRISLQDLGDSLETARDCFLNCFLCGTFLMNKWYFIKAGWFCFMLSLVPGARLFAGIELSHSSSGGLFWTAGTS